MTVSGAVNGVVTGIEDTVYIVIDSGVTDVTFEDLSLTTRYEYGSAINIDGGSDFLTATKSGDCSIEKSKDADRYMLRSAIRSYLDAVV